MTYTQASAYIAPAVIPMITLFLIYTLLFVTPYTFCMRFCYGQIISHKLRFCLYSYSLFTLYLPATSPLSYNPCDFAFLCMQPAVFFSARRDRDIFLLPIFGANLKICLLPACMKNARIYSYKNTSVINRHTPQASCNTMIKCCYSVLPNPCFFFLYTLNISTIISPISTAPAATPVAVNATYNVL